MRRLPKDGVAYHGYCAPFTVDACRSMLESVASALRLPLMDERADRYLTWRLGVAGAELEVSALPEEPWSQLHVGVDEHHLAEYGATGLTAVFTQLSDCLCVRLGRTTARGGVGYVSESELDGVLEFMDWLQYWGEPIVRRWGTERLAKGPFNRVEPRPHGACLLLLSAEPDDETMSRRAAAEFLDITLRPLYAKVTDGPKVSVAWR